MTEGPKREGPKQVAVPEGHEIRARLGQPFDRDCHVLLVTSWPAELKRPHGGVSMLKWEAGHDAYWHELDSAGDGWEYEGNNMCISGYDLHLGGGDAIEWANNILDTLLPEGTRVKWQGSKPIHDLTHVTS